MTKEGSSQMTITAHLLICSLQYGSVSATAYRDCQQGCCISHVRLLETEILCGELILKRMHYYITCIKSSALFCMIIFSLCHLVVSLPEQQRYSWLAGDFWFCYAFIIPSDDSYCPLITVMRSRKKSFRMHFFSSYHQIV